MQTYKTLSDVIALAEFAHRNQTDKAGLPYIEHPRRVMQAVQAQGAFPYVQMAAMLHDVTEDTAFTPPMLLELGVPEAAVNLVKLLDRDYSATSYNIEFWGQARDEEGAQEYYYKAIARVPEAKMIKLADIHDNTQLWRLSYLPVATQARLGFKYAEAIRMLNTNF